MMSPICCSTRLGSSGICSCIHIDGTTAPSAATTLHSSTPQGRDCMYWRVGWAQRQRQNTPMVSSEATTIEAICMSVPRLPSPPVNLDTATKATDVKNCKRAKTMV